MKKIFASLLVFALPTIVFGAGFAKQTIFLSTTAPIEGQTLLVHASVSNPTTTKFTGKLVMNDETGAIGTANVVLDAGAADDISVSWKPTAGDHTVTATLKDSTGTAVEESSQSFTIASKNPPITKTAATSSVELSTAIQDSIGNLSPTVQEYSAPVFKAIDSGRVFAANELHKAMDWSKQQVATPKQPSAFVDAPGTPKGGSTNSFVRIAATAALSVLSVLLYVISHPGVFYPIFAALFFYILWRFWRRYRRN